MERLVLSTIIKTKRHHCSCGQIITSDNYNSISEGDLISISCECGKRIAQVQELTDEDAIKRSWEKSVNGDEYDCLLCGRVITAKSCRYYSILGDALHIKGFCKCGTTIISLRETEQLPCETEQLPCDSSIVGKIIIIVVSISIGYLVLRQTDEDKQ